MQFIHKIKRNKLLIYATARLNPKTLCQVEETRHKILHAVKFHLYEIPKKAKV